MHKRLEAAIEKRHKSLFDVSGSPPEPYKTNAPMTRYGMSLLFLSNYVSIHKL